MHLLSAIAVYTLATSLVYAEQPEATINSKFVTKLSDKTFDEFTKSNKVSLVEYYAPCTMIMHRH